MPAALRRLHAALAESDTRPAEVGVGLLAVTYGAILALPGDSFASTPAWHGLAQMGDAVWRGHAEAVAATVMLAVGLAKIAGVAFDWRPLRRWTSLASAGMWAAFGTSVLVSVVASGAPPIVGLAFHYLSACAALWTFMRLSTDGR